MRTQGNPTADTLFRHGETASPCPDSDEQVYDPFRATVRCRGADGRKRTFETVLDSFSRRAFCVRISCETREGEHIFAVVTLSESADGDAAAPLRVAVRGTVSRVEKRPSQAYALAVKINGYRLL